MRFISYMLESCKTTAKKYGRLVDVESIFEKIEKDQSVQSWDLFLPTPFIKKDLGRNYRLVCSKHPVEKMDIVVIAFIACFPRGGSGEYEKFIQNPESVCGRFLPSENQLHDYIKSREKSLPPSPPEMNNAESEYLYDSLTHEGSSDMMIYESQEWVEAMKNPLLFDMSTRIYDLLEKLPGSPEGEICEDGKSGILIYYKNIPQFNSIFLIAPMKSKDEKTIISLRKRYSEIEMNTEGNILKYSRRSYPSYILADEQLWKSIQKNDVGNIALSPEESAILEGVSISTNERRFPLFINGRPGSGKSTILQYLFASYLCMYLRKDTRKRPEYPPIYLTYSENLLDSAAMIVEKIIQCNSSIALFSTSLFPESAIPRDKCYGVFHKFLLDILPEEKKYKFPLAKKITFPMFRNMWDDRRRKVPSGEVRRLSSELAWHVIRSYIKGMRYQKDIEFTPDSYSELPKNQQSVTTDTYDLVYENVWESWYKKICESNGHWDDQDLVFEVLNEPNINLSRYPAIFCDEAQDFSKLELDLILRLSLYSMRSIPPHELRHVPFVFAGDPFQTLNPTGFEWEALQANFHEKIVSGLDRLSLGKLEFNYQELSYNYRSGKYIVGLCNLLQLLRGLLFDQKDIKPQLNWFEEDSSMPVYFSLKDPLSEKKLRDQTELVIILPCQEGEEEDYVRNDALLSGLATSETDIRNFLSPMRAKGLEFSRVVLYKFGSACHKDYNNLFDPLSTSKPHTLDKDASLPLKYFMNRLYVGSSRAKNRLIIVDDDDGIKQLWNNDALKSFDDLIKKYPHSQSLGWTTDSINFIQKGMEENWTQDRDDPYTLAESFHASGLIEQDPYKLRLAEANYLRCDKPLYAKLCKAERYEIEQQYEKAGDLYIELDRAGNALQCFWKVGNLKKIAMTEIFSNTPEHRAACFHCGEHNTKEIKAFLDFLSNQIKGPAHTRLLLDKGWIRIMDECLDHILEDPSSKDNKEIYLMVSNLENEGLIPSNKKKYAEMAFSAGEYEHAIILWEGAGTKPMDEKNYCLSKAIVTDYPFNLEWYDRINQHAKVIEEWKTRKGILEDKYTAIVFKALLESEQYDEALNLLESNTNLQCMQKLYEVVRKKQLPDKVEAIGKLFIQQMAANENWQGMVKLFSDKAISQDTKEKLSETLAYTIAQSKEFRIADVDSKNQIANLLKQLFIDTKWKNIVPMRVAGAAFENAYKLVDTLEFYEGVWKKKRIPSSKRDTQYAIKRWVKTKMRLAEFLEKEGYSGFGKHREEAEAICNKRLGISKNSIPEEFECDFTRQTKAKEIDLSDDKRKAIILLHDGGMTNQQIKNSLGIDLNIIYEIINTRQNGEKGEII